MGLKKDVTLFYGKSAILIAGIILMGTLILSEIGLTSSIHVVRVQGTVQSIEETLGRSVCSFNIYISQVTQGSFPFSEAQVVSCHCDTDAKIDPGISVGDLVEVYGQTNRDYCGEICDYCISIASCKQKGYYVKKLS
jgi:hypothetical protein